MSHRKEYDKKDRQTIIETKDLSPLLLKILKARGLTRQKEIERFLYPKVQDLFDPLLLPNCEKAAAMLLRALQEGKKILVFGDYDTDGIISSFLVSDFLEQLQADVTTHIPDRFEDGYDISMDFVREHVFNQEIGLLVCVDCGTNSDLVMDHFAAEDTGTEVIVCDHHKPSGKLVSSDRVAIVNPHLDGSRYPFKKLSGAGVTFKFIHAALRMMGEDDKRKFSKDYLTRCMEMVAISIISDVMPLLEENRIMTQKGLKMLKETSNHGIQQLLQNNGCLNKDISVYDVAFIISPRINASGRIQNGRTSLDLLTSSKEEARHIAKELEALNSQRQEIQAKIVQQILSENELETIAAQKRIFIGRSQDWHEGVIGIVASKLSKKFQIPVILFSQREDLLKGQGSMLKGSGRSHPDFDLFARLQAQKGLFDKFGGHKSACGITLKEEHYLDFKDRMEKAAAASSMDQESRGEKKYDIEVGFDQLDEGFLSQYELLKPFGEGNPEPLFLTGNVSIRQKKILKEGLHQRLTLENNGRIFEAVFFHIDKTAAGLLQERKDQEGFHITYNLRKNTFGPNPYIQLVIYQLF